MDALVLAGGVPEPGEPLYAYTQGLSKSLVDVGGKPMIQWVLDALSGSALAGQVVISGLGADAHLKYARPLHCLGDSGPLLENIKAGLRFLRDLNPEATHALVITSDIPAITPEMVDWRVQRALEAQADIDYAVVARLTMEARFPASRRTYVRLRDVEVCGADLNALRVGLSVDERFWERVVAARKSPLRQAALLGWDTFFLVATRRVTLAQAEELVSRRLELKGKVHLSPYAEIAMDVDKPNQLEILRRELAGRAAASA